MVDFNALLAQKYSILQQDSDARTTSAQSEAQLNQARAGAITSMTPLDAEQKRLQNQALPGSLAAETAAKQAAADQARMQTSLAPGLAQSTIGLQTTQGMENNARASLFGQQGNLFDAQSKGLLHGLGSGELDADQASGIRRGIFGNRSFASGTSAVVGPGDGTVDTVPANLAAGEAVLNRGANELMPRGLVDTLNKIGLARMGMPDKGSKGKTHGYALGTPMVPGPYSIAGEGNENLNGPLVGVGFAEGTSNVSGGLVGAFGKINDALSNSKPAAPKTQAPSTAPMTGGINLQPSHYTNIPAPVSLDPPRPANNGLLLMDSTGAPKGYAKGTAKVSGPSKKASAPLMTPAMMEMLMQMQGGGAAQGGGGILTAPSAAQTLGMP
jgi:hypothetical protein